MGVNRFTFLEKEERFQFLGIPEKYWDEEPKLPEDKELLETTKLEDE